MKILASILLLLVAVPAFALERITAVITITNAPSQNDTLTVNGDVRTWKTTPTVPATQIAVTNVVGYAATNLFNHQSGYLYAGPLNLSYSATNAVRLIANSGNALVVSASGTWATVTMSTQLVTSMTAVRVPISGEPTDTVRTNISSLLVAAISDYSTNTIAAGATALSNHVNLSAAQTITGAKTFNGANTYSNDNQVIVGGYATNLSLINITTASGTLGNLTNGTFTNPSFTNGQNFGDPFRSPGTGTASEQFGFISSATGDYSIAFGNAATATDSGSSALGATASAIGANGTALGYGATAAGPSATALGNAATVDTLQTSSTAIGASAATTVSHQVRLGTSSEHVSIPGNLRVEGNITNINAVGTNTLDGTLELTPGIQTSLANGANTVDPSSNLWLVCSGPSGAFSIAGISGGRNGRLLIVENISGQVLTISDNSGTEPVAANRIRTGTGSDVTVNNNPGFVELIYRSAVSRWEVRNKSN